jgi:putative endonuclease
MLPCSDDAFYVGVTNDLDRRLGQHESGWDPTCYTHDRRPLQLVHCSEFYRIEDAIRWEKQLKGWRRAKKLALIENDGPEIQRLARLKTKRPSTSSG